METFMTNVIFIVEETYIDRITKATCVEKIISVDRVRMPIFKGFDVSDEEYEAWKRLFKIKALRAFKRNFENKGSFHYELIEFAEHHITLSKEWKHK